MWNCFSHAVGKSEHTSIALYGNWDSSSFPAILYILEHPRAVLSRFVKIVINLSGVTCAGVVGVWHWKSVARSLRLCHHCAVGGCVRTNCQRCKKLKQTTRAKCVFSIWMPCESVVAMYCTVCSHALTIVSSTGFVQLRASTNLTLIYMIYQRNCRQVTVFL